MSVIHLNTDEYLKVCLPLVKLLQASFGPNALKVMLKSDTGKLIITPEGSTVLRALHLAHPIGQMIVKCVVEHHEHFGDGSKTFMFMLTEALRQVQFCIKESSLKGMYNPSVHFHKELLLLGNGLDKLVQDILPNIIYPKIIQKAVSLSLELDQEIHIKQTCKSIMHTSLNGKWTKDVTVFLTSLLHRFVFEYCCSVLSLRDTISFIVDNFSFACLKSPMQHLSASQIFNGVLLQRDFLFAPNWTQHSSINFILLNCSLTLDQDDDTQPKDVIKVTTSSQITQTAHWQEKNIQQILSQWSSSGIQVVFTTKVVSKLEHTLYRRNNISVVQAVAEEDLQYLSLVSRCRIIYSPYENVDTVSIGVMANCKSVTAGGQRFVHLDLTGVKQMVLCGITDEICQQYYRDLQNSLKCVKSWLDGESLNPFCHVPSDGPVSTHSQNDFRQNCGNLLAGSEEHAADVTKQNEPPRECPLFSYEQSPAQSALAIAGGGYFEMLLHVYLEDFSSRSENLSLTRACRILKTACLIVPKVLLLNSYASKHQKRCFQSVQGSLVERIRLGQQAFVDHKSGTVSTSPDVSLEPLTSKIALINNLCCLMKQLLRMDKIVSVKTTHLENESD